MKNILIALIAIFLISSCSSVDFSKKREIEFDCNLNVEMFALDAPKICQLYGYSFKVVNMSKGKFEIAKNIDVNNENVDIIIKIEVDEEDKELEFKPKAIVKTGAEIKTQYFDNVNYPKEYGIHFLELIDNFRTNCTKVSFPNKP